MSGKPDIGAGTVRTHRLPGNLVVKSLVTVMVAITGLGVLPWRLVVIWTAFLVLAAGLEEWLLRLDVKQQLGPLGKLVAPWPRIAISALYALAAWQLISHGGAGPELVAFALMAASMVYVMLGYYRSPGVMLASIFPSIAVLGLVGYSLARPALERGDLWLVITSAFPVAIFAVLLWAARGQLTASWRDLTEARDAAHERESTAAAANRAKSQFLATMSHEFRTPLNAVLGMAQAMSTEKLSANQHGRLKVIRRSGENLLAILNDLLDLSKIEANSLELELVEFDLEHLVRSVAAGFRPMANKKGLDFDFDVVAEACGRYRGDSARIRRILLNLTENAIKFTDQGRVTLSVDRSGEELAFRVSDTGIGIEPADLAKLFDNFFQADGTLSRRYGGMGLGLPLSRRLAGLMGGTIEAASAVGEGSIFTLRLSLDSVRDTPPHESYDPALTRERPGEIRVLAAEDNQTNQLVLKTLLMQAGVTPRFVSNGRDAIAAWEAEAWDVILMDIQMPEMDGATAARAIRQREVETGRARTPILALTANAMVHQVADYEAAGMDGVVAKPIELRRLLAGIEQVLGEREPPVAEDERMTPRGDAGLPLTIA